jgi:phenylacetate-coenzyme A ligase PaaK-like adenylate-forming protein
MLLGTGCPQRSLHIESNLVHCEFLRLDDDEPAGVGEEGRLIVTTLAIEGSPLVRFETGDRVRLLPPCACGDSRPAIVVLGREGEVVRLAGRRLHFYEIIDAAAAAADCLDSSVFFVIVLPDRLLLRVEAEGRTGGDPHRVLRERLGDVKVEIECTRANELLDVEHLSRSPRVYKPVVVSDWRRPGRHVLSMGQGMIEWPRLGFGDISRWLGRLLRAASRRRRLAREIRVAKDAGR